ncbi:hypothetical protein FFLO_05037 [Filobasidium floriforme]|uniref:Uncharacterized protein n=1 Tax=Filobasidium floriforme TaxID=5210 RepID=A0A8K0JI35_9TREE|nr:uncharacterized protein HD553DRAFT_141261 [Filobasidium floriforme]KAG7530438.1 hypothetical protein FFLO_05037 [Filobasidium floriforme]KAH8078565.1 hypothetical protein HD553DRAFT_141261 [Filobasidium floriforme]
MILSLIAPGGALIATLVMNGGVFSPQDVTRSPRKTIGSVKLCQEDDYELALSMTPRSKNRQSDKRRPPQDQAAEPELSNSTGLRVVLHVDGSLGADKTYPCLTKSEISDKLPCTLRAQQCKGRIEVRVYRILTPLKSTSKKALDRWDPKTRWKEGAWHTFVFNYTTSKHAKDKDGPEACCTCLSLEAQEQAVTDWARLQQVKDEHKATILRKCGIEENLTDEEEFQWETDQRHQREEAERRERQAARERALRAQEERKREEREAADRKHVQGLERQFEKTRQEIQTAQVSLERREQELGRREESLSQRERECTQREQESVRLRQKLGRLQRVLERQQRGSDERDLEYQERTRSLDQRERAIDLRLERVQERMVENEDVKPRIGKVEEEVPGDAEVPSRVDERVDTRVDGGRDPVSEPSNVEDRLARLEEQLARLVDSGRDGASSSSRPSRKRARREDDDDALA